MTDWPFSLALAATLLLFVALPLLLVAAVIRRSFEDHAAATRDQLELFAEYAGKGAGTDPALIERMESAERRVESLAADAAKFFRKTAQERRRIETVAGEPEDDDQLSLTPADLRAQLNGSSAADPPTPGRPRLRPRGMTRR